MKKTLLKKLPQNKRFEPTTAAPLPGAKANRAFASRLRRQAPAEGISAFGAASHPGRLFAIDASHLAGVQPGLGVSNRSQARRLPRGTRLHASSAVPALVCQGLAYRLFAVSHIARPLRLNRALYRPSKIHRRHFSPITSQKLMSP